MTCLKPLKKIKQWWNRCITFRHYSIFCQTLTLIYDLLISFIFTLRATVPLTFWFHLRIEMGYWPLIVASEASDPT